MNVEAACRKLAFMLYDLGFDCRTGKQSMTENHRAPQSRRKHPFRRSAVEKYQRASGIDTPELTLQWRLVLPMTGVAALVLAALLW